MLKIVNFIRVKKIKFVEKTTSLQYENFLYDSSTRLNSINTIINYQNYNRNIYLFMFEFICFRVSTLITNYVWSINRFKLNFDTYKLKKLFKNELINFSICYISLKNFCKKVFWSKIHTAFLNIMFKIFWTITLFIE